MTRSHDAMLIGQTLFNSPEPRFSPWLPRGGDHAVFACEILALSPDAELTITVQTKNTEDSDAQAANAATFATIGGSGTFTKDASGLKELVRYRYEVADGQGMGNPVWIHYRMLEPIWLFN